MPTPEQQYENASRHDFFRRDVAAEVPAIHITRQEWDSVLFILRALTDVADAIKPHPIETALIRGGDIAEAVSKADELRAFLVG
jgi:hypothetical protein